MHCVFYKLTWANIAYIVYIALRILRNIALLRILQQAISFLHFTVRVASGDYRVVSFAMINQDRQFAGPFGL